jgi:hypothetical protein
LYPVSTPNPHRTRQRSPQPTVTRTPRIPNDPSPIFGHYPANCRPTPPPIPSSPDPCVTPVTERSRNQQHTNTLPAGPKSIATPRTASPYPKTGGIQPLFDLAGRPPQPHPRSQSGTAIHSTTYASLHSVSAFQVQNTCRFLRQPGLIIVLKEVHP